jgi:hypothetical protein
VIASTIRQLAQDRACLGERLNVVRLPCEMSALGKSRHHNKSSRCPR